MNSAYIFYVIPDSVRQRDTVGGGRGPTTCNSACSRKKRRHFLKPPCICQKQRVRDTLCDCSLTRTCPYQMSCLAYAVNFFPGNKPNQHLHTTTTHITNNETSTTCFSYVPVNQSVNKIGTRPVCSLRAGVNVAARRTFHVIPDLSWGRPLGRRVVKGQTTRGS